MSKSNIQSVTLERLTINKIEHQIYIWGREGLPLLFFIHGWMDSGANFRFLCEHLQEQYRCIAIDLRGHGQTEHTSNPLGYYFYEYLDDVHQFFHHYSPQAPVRVVGHSMGGNIVSLYAGVFPERVKEFINVEGLGIKEVPGDHGPQRCREWLESIHSEHNRLYPTFESYLRNLQRRYPLIQDPVILQSIGESLIEKKEGGWALKADLKHTKISPYPFQMQNIAPFWSAIKARVLFVQGAHTQMGDWMDNSHDLEEEVKRRLHFYPPGTQRILMPECAHMIHYERPYELAQVIINFLTGKVLETLD